MFGVLEGWLSMRHDACPAATMPQLRGRAANQNRREALIRGNSAVGEFSSEGRVCLAPEFGQRRTIAPIRRTIAPSGATWCWSRAGVPRA